MDNITERLKYLRKNELHLTQENFGKKLGFKQNSIALIESGRNTLTDRTIADICREFNVNEDWLRYGTGEIFIETPTEFIDVLCKERNFGILEKTILENFINFNENDRLQFINYLAKLTSNKKNNVIDENTIIFTDVTEEEKQLLTTYLETIRNAKNIKNYIKPENNSNRNMEEFADELVPDEKAK